jgi:hypothetical protein
MITSSACRRDAVGSSFPSLRRQSYCLCLTSIDSKSQESGSEMCASKVFDLLDIGITLWIFDSCVHSLSVQFFKTNRFHPTQLHQPRRIFPIKSHNPPPPFKILLSHLLQSKRRIFSFLPPETIDISHRYSVRNHSSFPT